MVSVDFNSFRESVPEALDEAGLAALLEENSKDILIKPNLVDTQAHPITSHVECIAAIIEYVQEHCDNDIIVGDGSGGDSTQEVFDALGYDRLADEYGVKLMDLDSDEVEHLKNPKAAVWKEFYCPKTVCDSFVINTPVLKRHSMSTVTLAAKNLVGICPARYYQVGGHWRKSATHNRLHEVIFDLNNYVKSDFILMDASIGMAEAHLWGPTCNPPVNKILAGSDVTEMDKESCALLGIDWKRIKHVSMMDKHGTA